ncbi:hypothetical protein WR25_21562 [Diploscapter pachys]|uniref:Vacuolar protein sorting-associated protein 35 n=1 Tax=Diploscapter pachys TaxID=2018661 RepID=A0A2A2JP29_9BILA|nr:hypothetical protein WR25_21562 [Diploscapter pachys]
MGLEPALTSVTEQEKMLENASKVVKAEAFEMKRCLDKSKTMDALKHSINFLNELRTNDLSPKFYYRLYMDCTNELQHLEAFLVDEYQRDKSKIGNLYECVQYASSIVPRLYLLVTVGVVYLKCGEGSRSEILSDIVAMCRGIQHPLRGLFLRNYLLQSTRSLLPDVPKSSINEMTTNLLANEESANEENGETNGEENKKNEPDGTVADAIAFILDNFGEMNKLWVRMQHQGPSKEREKRERERMELRILVGTNLVRLSQLESLTEEIYVQDVLPKVLEQIVSCRDCISQEYLMECVIQVFADDFHLATLNEFLFACGELVPEVNVKDILIALIDRLALYSSNEGKGKPKQAELFGIFSEQAKQLIENRPQMPVEDIVSLHAALISLAIKCYPDNIDYASVCFQSLKDIFANKDVKSIGAFSPIGKELTKLLHLPIDEYKNVLRLQEIKEYNAALEAFDYRGRCNNAAYVIQSMMENETVMNNEDELGIVFALIDSLLVDQPDQPPNIHVSIFVAFISFI